MVTFEKVKKRRIAFGMTLFLFIEGIIIILIDLLGMIDKNLSNERLLNVGYFIDRNGLYIGALLIIMTIFPLKVLLYPPKNPKLVDERDYAINDKSAVYGFLGLVFILGQLTIIEALTIYTFSTFFTFFFTVACGVIIWAFFQSYFRRVN